MKSIHKFVVFLVSGFSLVPAGLAQTALPMMRLSTAAVSAMNVTAGTNPTPQTIQIFNAGGGTLSPAVSSSATWLQGSVGAAVACTSPFAGTCLPLTVTYNTAALAAGTYTGFLSVSDPNAVDSPQTVSVTVTILGYGAPAGLTLFTAPGGTATATVNTHAMVTAQASTATGGNWLTVSLSGSGSYSFYYPYQVKATAQPGQGPGAYSGSVQISGSNTASDNATIPVTLNVTTSPIAQVTPAAISLIAGTGGQASQTLSVANAGQGALTLSGATPTVTTGTGWLTATVTASTVTVTANTAGLQPGGYQGSVALATNAANNASLTIPVSLFVTAQSGPVIGFGGIVDNTGQPRLAPGDIGVIYGTQLLTGSAAPAVALPLATTLGNVQVLVNGVAAPLYYAAGGQIDFQVPYETAPGTAIIQVVNNGTAGNKVSATIVARAPEILLTGGVGSAPIVVDYTTGALLQQGVFAHAGDTLVVYAIGLGQTSPAATDGAAATSSPLEAIGPPISATLTGSTPFSPSAVVTPLFVGLTPGFAGLYQINLTIPATFPVPAGNLVTLSLNINGVNSAPVQFSMQ